MSQEQVSDHVFRQMEGDMWCVRCGMPKAAHLFLSEVEMKAYEAAQRAPEDQR
jgi:hypothetical protein